MRGKGDCIIFFLQWFGGGVLMVCVKCNHEQPNDSLFCHFCGNSLKEEQFRAYNQSIYRNRTSSNSKLLILNGVICFILIFIFSIIFYNQNLKIKDLSDILDNLNDTAETRKTMIDTLNNKISEKDEIINKLLSDKSELQIEINNNSHKAKFLMKYVVFVVDDFDSVYYHTYDCELYKNCKSFWIYSIKAAEGNDYKACPKCH
ncbi:MAG: hypothetical protein K0S55_53 [Clostridia bacterium]|nr:hypothetical protein [Clostridia bacterium]